MGAGLVAANQLIFVAIAAYRDTQLLPTVADLLGKADEPGLLRFGICWQHDPEEMPLPFVGDSRFRVVEVDWRESRGACWARAEIMKLWAGEQWYLQIDSHCRFVQGWDTKLIRMMGQTASPKPILSTYASAFTPRQAGEQSAEVLAGEPQMIGLETFTEDGIPKFKPLAIPAELRQERPVAARCVAAGFLFAPGSFVREVPYDPELYFFGEEISMTLRAFTSGYDLFHPVENVAWHDYVRAYAKRHWEDGATDEAAAVTGRVARWKELDALSRKKVRQLLAPESGLVAAEPSGQFGLGSVRTVEEYESYAGVSFRLRKLQDYTRYAFLPPNPPAAEGWAERIYSWLVRVAVEVAALPAGALDESSFWVVTVQDEDRREIRRHDFQRKQMAVNGDETQIVLICEIESGIIPAFWTVQPFTRAAGWCSRLEGRLGEGDFSIVMD